MSNRKEKQMCLPRASKGRGYIAPNYSSFTRAFVRLVGPLYLKYIEGVSEVSIENLDFLFTGLKDHFSQKKKLIIAFRHVAKEDAPVLMYLISRKLDSCIASYNKRVPKEERIIAHAQFLYGSDVLEWAGKLAAWAFPRIGCIPVVNRSTNSKGLSTLRECAKKGIFPLALAIESQVTYHMGVVGESSFGISSLALWGEEGGQEVAILPVALGYSYHKDTKFFIHHVIEKWEKETHITVPKEFTSLHDSLLFITEETIKILESLYRIISSGTHSMKERIDRICSTSMDRSENITHSKGSGSLLDRLFQMRKLGNSTLKPVDFQLSSMSPLSRSIADFNALHAHIALWHSQIVDVLQYVDPSYINEPTPIGRMSEYALNILDVINRIKGGNIDSRYTPKGKHAFVYIGESISPAYESSMSRKEKRNSIDRNVFSSLQRVSKELEKKWMRDIIYE